MLSTLAQPSRNPGLQNRGALSDGECTYCGPNRGQPHTTPIQVKLHKNSNISIVWKLSLLFADSFQAICRSSLQVYNKLSVQGPTKKCQSTGTVTVLLILLSKSSAGDLKCQCLSGNLLTTANFNQPFSSPFVWSNGIPHGCSERKCTHSCIVYNLLVVNEALLQNSVPMFANLETDVVMLQ